MKLLTHCLLILMLLQGISSFGQISFKEQNVSYYYDIHSELLCDYKISFPTDDSFDLQFVISLNSKIDTPFDSLYSFALVFKEDYEAEEDLDSLGLQAGQILMSKRDKKFYFNYKGKTVQDAELLELVIRNKITTKEYVYDISLDEGAEYGSAGLTKFYPEGDMPLMRNFTASTDPLQIKNDSSEHSELWVYLYKSDFDVAVPPMIVDYKSTSKSLTVDTLMKVRSDTAIGFATPGLYFVQKDTSSLEGIGFRVENSPFPKLGTYEQLVGPLRYISTKEEFEKFTNSLNLEKPFERFWIEKAESTEGAKNSIRNFYQHVAEANFFFTGYKEGWKTDMGMIYIIYGKPDRVYRHEEYEEWVYNQSINLPALRFTFVKIKNVFADNHYTLVRDKKFDKHWFRAVELWRSGKN